MLSAGIANLPIELSAERLLLKAGNDYHHPFDIKALKDLPNAIQNPIAIFDSTKKDGGKVLLTELQHRKSNFIAVIRVQKKDKIRKYNIEINSVKTIFPKDNKQGIVDWINSKDKLLQWADKKKALNFISTHSTHLNASGNKMQGFSSANLQKELDLAKKNIKKFKKYN